MTITTKLLTLSLLIPFLADADTAQPEHACCSPTAISSSAPGSFSQNSVYQLTSTWTNSAGKTVFLKDFRGRPQVVAMFFANCTMACPIIVQDMQRIEAALPEEMRSKVGFTLISFDTERDTVQALEQYRVSHGLAADRWTLLRGNPEDVLELAAVLGVNFKKDAQGQFAHSNVVTLLNKDGEIVVQRTGLNVSPDDLVARIKGL